MLIRKICDTLSLGTLLEAPTVLHGGYTHRMLALTTSTGRYAVKLLNPDIMQRETALPNYRRAEALEALLEAEGLPILSARTINGRKLHCVEGQYVYVFDYFDGHALREDEITPAHCARMGDVLARIHQLDRRNCPEPFTQPDPIDWQRLAEDLLTDAQARTEALLLQDSLALLQSVTAEADAAQAHLPRVQTICHNDMDAKNVLWQEDQFRIIDLECLGWADPLQEMIDLAVSWGGWPLNEARFTAFVRAYYIAGGDRPADAALLLDSRRNHIDWLAYNAVRALGKDAQERAMGRSQIVETIGKIAEDQRNRERILRWMTNL